MKPITKSLAAATAIAAVVVAPVQAGTRLDPEYTDPAGDTPFILTLGENADWADIVAAWFEPIDGGVRVNVEAVDDADAADEDAQFYVNWDVIGGQDQHCYASMYVNVSEGDEPALNERNAGLNYTCADETQPYTIPIVDVTLELNGMWDGGTFPIVTDGPVVSIDIPFSVFSQGESAALYHAGTGLQLTSVSSQILMEYWFQPADHQDVCEPTYTPPFGFESGCPEDARLYVIE